MIHVICLKFGDKYSTEYVNKLYRSIKRNTSKGFLFTCYTDAGQNIMDEVDVQPLPYHTTDWHSKIGLYNQDLYFKDDQIFYFDLDTVVTGNLDEIFEYSGDFIILRDVYNKALYGSGLMSWRPSAVNHMWTNYTRGQVFKRGDQEWCEIQYPKADIWQEMYPEKIISYKVHIDKRRAISSNWAQHKGTLETSSIVFFHGRPRPHEVRELNWMKEHWV